jgi:hypothetical protein
MSTGDNQSWQPVYSPEPPPKAHWGRRILIAAIVLIVLIVVLALTLGGNSPKRNPGNVSAGNPTPETTFAPPSAAPSPSPTVQPASRIKFVITGNVPASEFGGLDINYGSDSSTNDVTLNSLAGRVVYSMPFDPSAEYYSVDVTFSSAGSVSCKIVVIGPYPDVPLVASKGSANGGNNGGDCSAQAAPNNSTGTSWDNEQ